MIVFYESATTEFGQGEVEQVNQQEQPPQVGDTLSMGSDRLWAVLDVDTYSNGSEAVYVAHCEPVGVKPLPRHAWYWVQAYKEHQTYREPNSLKLYLDSNGELVTSTTIGVPGFELGASVPKRGTVLPRYDVERHTTNTSPWGIVEVRQYKPEMDKGLIFSSIYVCQCDYIAEFAAA